MEEQHFQGNQESEPIQERPTQESEYKVTPPLPHTSTEVDFQRIEAAAKKDATLIGKLRNKLGNGETSEEKELSQQVSESWKEMEAMGLKWGNPEDFVTDEELVAAGLNPEEYHTLIEDYKKALAEEEELYERHEKEWGMLKTLGEDEYTSKTVNRVDRQHAEKEAIKKRLESLQGKIESMASAARKKQ